MQFFKTDMLIIHLPNMGLLLYNNRYKHLDGYNQPKQNINNNDYPATELKEVIEKKTVPNYEPLPKANDEHNNFKDGKRKMPGITSR